MLKFLKKEAAMTHTENGAVTYESTQSCCLDLFSTIGAMRQAGHEEILQRFTRAYAEDPDLAMKILFFARDVRGGLGERKVFRVILQYLAEHEQNSALRNLESVPEYGRFDDLLVLLDTPCREAVLNLIARRLAADLDALENGGKVSLLAKWLPSVNASNRQTIQTGKQIARALGMSGAQYRKTLSRLRAGIAILENNLRQRDYTFDYSIQPSKAMFQYRRAFIRNDRERYVEFIHQVKNGEAKLNTGTIYPYEIITPCLSGTMTAEERRAVDATWNALPEYSSAVNALAVVDGSGSMYWDVQPSPAAVALSLGIYCAQRNQGAFHNHFITFSERPRLVEIKGRDLWEQARFCESYNECANTNVEAVFNLLLETAVKHRLKQKDLPETLYIISDMEFDCCAENAGLTNFENAKRRFAAHGYRLPHVVFWNVASRALQQPVTQNEQGVALVSGCTPRLFEMVLSGQFSPYQYMLETLRSERYRNIAA